MTSPPIAQQSGEFLEYLEEWYRSLPALSLTTELTEPEGTAVFSADMVVGFCSQGPLANPRVANLVRPVVGLFRQAHAAGVRHFILAQDTHHKDTPEFRFFPPHCVQGTEESKTIPELLALPFSHEFTVIEKNSLSPALGTTLERWLESHPELRDLIVVGDCTDLCTYNLAMHLRLRANALGLAEQRVILPANAVDTFDMPIATAREMGAMAHPGDLFHLVFLYHMALNGIQVVSQIY